jgi:hypothetical protein
MNGTGSSRPKPSKRVVIESDAEKSLWNDTNKRVDICLVYHDAKDEDDEDCLVLQLTSPMDDPEVLEDYPDAKIVWQTIRLDVFAVVDLRRALNEWVDEG